MNTPRNDAPLVMGTPARTLAGYVVYQNHRWIQRRLLERWGIDENGLIPIAVREASRTHKVFLVSASKSGAEVAQAIGRELSPPETEAVVGWLSIVGVVRGTPFTDRVLGWDLRWVVRLKFALEGFDLEGMKSMQTARQRRAFADLRFPPHV